MKPHTVVQRTCKALWCLHLPLCTSAIPSLLPHFVQWQNGNQLSWQCTFSEVMKKKLPMLEFPAADAARQTDQRMHAQPADTENSQAEFTYLGYLSSARPCTKERGRRQTLRIPCASRDQKGPSFLDIGPNEGEF